MRTTVRLVIDGKLVFRLLFSCYLFQLPLSLLFSIAFNSLVHQSSTPMPLCCFNHPIQFWLRMVSTHLLRSAFDASIFAYLSEACFTFNTFLGTTTRVTATLSLHLFIALAPRFRLPPSAGGHMHLSCLPSDLGNIHSLVLWTLFFPFFSYLAFSSFCW